MHCWCGKEWMHILHKSKGRLLFQECTGSNPPDNDLTFNHKNGHKWWMVVLLKEPRNAAGTPVSARPKQHPLHLSVLHVRIYTKHKSLLQTDNLCETQVFTTCLSTPTKASQAPYLSYWYVLLPRVKCSVITGKSVGRCLLLWILTQEIEEWRDMASSLCLPFQGGPPPLLSMFQVYQTGLTSPAKFCCSE